MSKDHKKRISDVLAVAVLLGGLAPLAYGQCSSAGAATKFVHVEFIGCSATMAADVVVTIGQEPILVTKQPDKSSWRGEAAETFTIRERLLTSVDVRGVRIPCTVEPRPYSDGACVAKYKVHCEPLWQLKVAPKGTDRAEINYERQPTSKTVQACELTKKEQAGVPAMIRVGTEKLLVTANFGGRTKTVDLYLDLFEGKPKWTFTELVALLPPDRAAAPGNPNQRALAKQKVGNDLEFVKE